MARAAVKLMTGVKKKISLMSIIIFFCKHAKFDLYCCLNMMVEKDTLLRKVSLIQMVWFSLAKRVVRKHVNDLYEDLRDGHNLISLLEVLSGDTLPRERDFLKTLRLVSATEACEYEQHEDVEDEDKGPREKGRMRFHRLQNVQIALDYLKRRQV
ncbi:Dystonin [Camelus dromedarius]|uniref:Dystonin n=1 Tax=Camelus dromedarius TaxID=9838 RepID=A0A5N4CRE4_CAMDR|nr:Dystonin [Camelus dromedarius]